MTVDARARAIERRRIPRLRLAVGVTSLLVIAAFLYVPSFAPWMLRFEHWTADLRTALLSDRALAEHPKIVVVTINDETLRNYVSSPVDRELLAKIIAAIDAAGARAIGLDVFFLKPTDAAKDDALLAGLQNARARVILGSIDERGELQPFQREFQTAYLAKSGRDVGYLNLRHELDDVVRYTAAPAADSLYPKSFARLLAESVDAVAGDEGKPISWLLPPKESMHAFKTIAAQDILTGEPPADAKGSASASANDSLKDRIVLVGGDFPLRDRHRTPLHVRDGTTVPGVMIHAQILAGMLDPKRGITELGVDDARRLVAAVAIAGFIIGWWLWQSSIVGLLGWSFVTGVLLAVDAFCFKEMRLLLPFNIAAIAWVAGLTAGKSWRFVAASRTLQGEKS